MTRIYNLNGDRKLTELVGQVRAAGLSSPMNNSGIGEGGIEVYDQGTINVSDGNLIVNGTATISGVLNADGTVTLSGDITISGPLTISGATDITGATTIAGNTTVTGDVTTTGSFKNNGPTELNGTTKTTGTLSVEGATTLNNNLTVAAGKKIGVGGLSLENTGLSGGQVNFPGGSITASSALGMLINHATVEIAGTTVKISGLPDTAQPANLYADSSGRLFRSTV